MHTGRRKKSASQISNENKFSGQLAATSKHCHSIFITKMMEYE